jgi:outer membrane protein OmpA-like peptidoglycan-associated protein
MKNLRFLILIIVLHFPIILFSQTPADNLYYVVIGAFANPRNANDFVENAKSRKLEAQVLLIQERKLHYIHILGTPEKDQAIALALKLQSESTYSDAWVYSNLAENSTGRVSLEQQETVEEKVNDITTQPNEPITLADGSRPFIFKLKSIETGHDVAGDVDIFDADVQQGRKVISYRGNDVVNVKPINKSGNMAVVCDVFGYRKVQLPLNFSQPTFEDAISLQDGNIVVNFDLVRLKKGDKVIMYNVYFFNHAAIMRPESRYEVNALLEYLQEKPTSKIKIHGHANGNDFGKIITLGDSKDYYSLSRDNKEGKGSAIKLSEERARIIQSYLVSQGIDINRMELKAWGGKMPIYEKDHSLAQANLRVEIEILEE